MTAGFDHRAFHEAAVRTPSHEGVAEMRTLLVDALDDAGAGPTVDDRGCVVASRGSGGTHLVLNTHVDTVPPHVPYDREGETVRGRGACDAKGPLAAMLSAFLEADIAAERGGDGRFTLAISPDEETTQTGGAGLARRLDADGVVVGEPTELDVCPAARGQFEGVVRIGGESAHAADPGSGTNAVAAAAAVLGGLETYDDSRGLGVHDRLGAPTLTPTGIEGGEASNQVPASCTVTFDRRSVPPETAEGFVADLGDHLAGLASPEIDLSVSLARPELPHPEAFETDADEPVVRTLQQHSGGTVRPFGAATEASYFASRAPTVVFGPGALTDDEGPVAHSEREYVDLGQVDAAARALRETVEALL